VTWRKLEPHEAPFAARGLGPNSGGGEIVCPDFDTWADYEIVWVDRLGRIAKQGPHVLVAINHDPTLYVCSCGREFTRAEAQVRTIQ
jgi:hypothetical protein